MQAFVFVLQKGYDEDKILAVRVSFASSAWQGLLIKIKWKFFETHD